jgi:hypothetical protein
VTKAYCRYNRICIPPAAKPCSLSSIEMNVITLLKTSAENEAVSCFKMNWLLQLSLDFSTIGSSFTLDSCTDLMTHVPKSSSAAVIYCDIRDVYITIEEIS